MCVDTVINFAKITTYIHIHTTYYILHTHTTYTYYIQNQWSHSLFLNYVQARQKNGGWVVILSYKCLWFYYIPHLTTFTWMDTIVETRSFVTAHLAQNIHLIIKIWNRRKGTNKKEQKWVNKGYFCWKEKFKFYNGADGDGVLDTCCAMTDIILLRHFKGTQVLYYMIFFVFCILSFFFSLKISATHLYLTKPQISHTDESDNLKQTWNYIFLNDHKKNKMSVTLIHN